jgi:hypothetical protein
MLASNARVDGSSGWPASAGSLGPTSPATCAAAVRDAAPERAATGSALLDILGA